MLISRVKLFLLEFLVDKAVLIVRFYEKFCFKYGLQRDATIRESHIVF